MLERWWWCTWLLETIMTGGVDRCQRRWNVTAVMGRGPDGGCGVEENPCPCPPINNNRVSSSNLDKITTIAIDYFSQAKKVISERSPFDSGDAQPSSVLPTLPTALATQLDGRKRLKNLHLASQKKASRPEKARGSNVWVQTQDYFRDLTVDDIDKLCDMSNLGSFLSNDKCFEIPLLGNENGFPDNLCNVEILEEDQSGVNNNGNVVGLESGVVVKEEVKEGNEQFKEVDSLGANELLVQEEKATSSFSQPSTSFSGLEWVLGSRSKIYLTSERPNKKRKLLGGDAGLEKILVAYPVEGSSSLCHYCSLGDTGDQLNRLVVCTSCGVGVHERCYGVQDYRDGSWLCSWCEQGNEVLSKDKPCVLCPKQGGALKPVRKKGFGDQNGGLIEFAHLFCCQWMPEVYIEDTWTMEPILNVERIKETRKKIICSLCKVKWGACVRCSNGACRTSFHPICAREARHRIEIWGKFGCDDVELRAFCSKHSEVQNNSSTQQVELVANGSDSCISKIPVASAVIKPPNLKIGQGDGDTIAVHGEGTDKDLDKLSIGVLHKDGFSDTRPNSKLLSECGHAQPPVNMDTLVSNSVEDVNTSETLNYLLILKKLIDRGKVNAKDVASEIGVSPDSLASVLSEECFIPDLHYKLANWLRNHAYIGSLAKNLKVKIKSTIVSKAEMGVADDSDTVTESDIADVVPVKSLPPRRRTKSNIKILKDDKFIYSSKEIISDDGLVMDEVQNGQLFGEDLDCPSKDSVADAIETVSVEALGVPNILASKPEVWLGDPAKPSSPSFLSDGGQADEAAISDQNETMTSELRNSTCSVDKNHIPDFVKSAATSSFYVHPHIHNQLTQIQNAILSKSTNNEYDGPRDRESLEASSSSGICCRHQNRHCTSTDVISKFEGVHLEHLVKARSMGILQMSPVDEVEGELIFHQHKLLCNAVARKRFSDDLVCKVVKSLPQEIDAEGNRKWDAVLVNQYLYELREAKKRGRKERRHKEAQAVLAAASAAAAASSRISSVRKDTIEESAHLENPLKMNASNGRPGLYSQHMPRAKETLPRLAFSRVSVEKNSELVRSTMEFSKEHPRTCDICRRPDTIFNPILVCSGCKVAVHLDCYRSVKDSASPWYCELCKDLLSSRNSGAPALNSGEKPYFVAECGLCGGTAGAFRKSIDGQWIHAFCAEWVLDSTFRRGQVHPIEGMETVSKGCDVCHICHRRQGVCIKCNYGHCHSMFHPSCARSAGFYMYTRNGGGKMQHKAYCEKHSLEQRAKAENQKHGVEELQSLKQVRVELERLRLLCERIIKREKLKRELVLCSHQILSSNRDSLALSAKRSPFVPPDVSSESATTSLKGYTDDYKSGSEAIQRSDDITVDSTVAGKRRVMFPMSVDNDQRKDDSPSSQHIFMQEPAERASFSGKTIPHRPSSRNLSDDGEKRSKYRKHTETFEKELVMTSDQASLKNQRLPKGFVYVPIRCLSKEKETIPDADSQEPLEHRR